MNADDTIAKITADRLVSAYIKLRNERSRVLAAFEEEDGKLKEQQELVSSKLLEICKEVGADSLKTIHGTVSRKVATRYWPSDWGALHAFIKEHDALNLLEQRIHQTNMKQFLEEHPDMLPPGLNSDSKYTISVRKR